MKLLHGVAVAVATLSFVGVAAECQPPPPSNCQGGIKEVSPNHTKPFTADPASVSPYNCEIVTDFNYQGARVIYDEKASPPNIRWPYPAGVPIVDGFGNYMATTTDTTAMFNFGQRKLINGTLMVYGWGLNNWSLSGWVPETYLGSNATLFALRSPTLTTKVPDPPDVYSTVFTVSGGNPEEFRDSTAAADPDPRMRYLGIVVNGQRVGIATDYLVTPTNKVNVTYNVPGFGLGGFSVDSVPVGQATFRRYTAVSMVKVPLYRKNGTLAGKSIDFVYGTVFNGNTAVRTGWISRQALTP